MNTLLALEILLHSKSYLTNESGEPVPYKQDFLCNAITYAAKNLIPDGSEIEDARDVVVNALRDEVTLIIDGFDHLRGFMFSKFGIEFRDMPLSFTQPIRRGMLNKLIARYQKANGLPHDGDLV